MLNDTQLQHGRKRWPLALFRALLEPRPYLVQDWPKGQGTWKPEKCNSTPRKPLSTSHPLVQILENSFSEAMARTSLPQATGELDSPVTSPFSRHSVKGRKWQRKEQTSHCWGLSGEGRYQHRAQVIFSILMVLRESVQTHRTLQPRVTPKVIIFIVFNFTWIKDFKFKERSQAYGSESGYTAERKN